MESCRQLTELTSHWCRTTSFTAQTGQVPVWWMWCNMHEFTALWNSAGLIWNFWTMWNYDGCTVEPAASFQLGALISKLLRASVGQLAGLESTCHRTGLLTCQLLCRSFHGTQLRLSSTMHGHHIVLVRPGPRLQCFRNVLHTTLCYLAQIWSLNLPCWLTWRLKRVAALQAVTVHTQRERPMITQCRV